MPSRKSSAIVAIYPSSEMLLIGPTMRIALEGVDFAPAALARKN
jgi:hypothetical protein